MQFCPASAVTAQSNSFHKRITNNVSEDSCFLGCNIVSMGWFMTLRRIVGTTIDPIKSHKKMCLLEIKRSQQFETADNTPPMKIILSQLYPVYIFHEGCTRWNEWLSNKYLFLYLSHWSVQAHFPIKFPKNKKANTVFPATCCM
jgi:hypothetical protein